MSEPACRHRRFAPFFALVATLFLADDGRAASREPIRLLNDFALSPDGETLVFSWAGNIWTAATGDGAATPITRHAANDRTPRFSPDGATIAFTSNRGGSYQVYTVPADGGAPEQMTHHSEGFRLVEYFPDGERFLASGARDHFWRSSTRFLTVPADGRGAERVLFDAHGSSGHLSPDGRSLLFTREGTRWFRKGYHGSQASQIWRWDQDGDEFTRLLADEHGYRYPVWRADGGGFFYSGQQDGNFNLYEYDFATGVVTQHTKYEDDAVLWLTSSRDGETLVFRRRFDLYRFHPGSGAPPERIDLYHDGDPIGAEMFRRTLTSASECSFSDDGLEVAFIAGGDLWVMDTELREPKRITSTPEEETSPLFTEDGDAILFISDRENQSDIWRAERSDTDAYWWRNDDFVFRRVTEDAAAESELRRSPDGSRVSFVRGRGDLMIMEPDGDDVTRLLAGWEFPSYDWSPDSEWIVYSVSDNDFNRDIWVTRIDGSTEPFNLSVHPDNDYGPVWSPDGKMIAFTGRRSDQEVDVHYVWLTKSDAEQDSRDRRFEKALEKMEKGRKKKNGGKGNGKPAGEKPAAEASGAKKAEDGAEKNGEDGKKPDAVAVEIDFDGIHDRIGRISIGDYSERRLLWIEDQKLAFYTSVNAKRGMYTVTFPDERTPKFWTEKYVSDPVRLKQAKKIAGISSQKPSLLATNGKLESFEFSVRQQVDHAGRNQAAFDQAWRAMRDGYYDEALGNRNWDAIRRKYRDAAAAAIDTNELRQVVELMLGELNGSHLGFSASSSTPRSSLVWTETTAHLGLCYDEEHRGPGWKVALVIADGPTAKNKSKIEPGEIVLSVDGVAVDPSLDASAVLKLNGARPDVILWPQPGDLPRGKDEQLERAIELLLADVEEWKARPRPALRKATERTTH